MISTRQFTFLGPGQITFEPGGANSVGKTVSSLGGKRVFVVTDKGVKNANLLGGMLASFKQEGLSCAVFDGVEPNPSVGVVEKGFELSRKNHATFCWDSEGEALSIRRKP